jgi:hypothetical protein
MDSAPAAAGAADGRGYSVWAIPSNSSSSTLSPLIQSLAATHSSVTFPAHITLLGDIRPPAGVSQEEVERRVAEALLSASPSLLAPSTSTPSRVRFARAAAGELFYRCVYALCEMEPALVSANAALQSEFGHAEPFMPHLSLLYADIPDAETREGIRAGVEGAVAAAGGVEVERVELWDTTGHLRGASTHEGRWRLLRSWQVGGGGRS